MDFAYLYTSFDGRINRQPYWVGVLVMVAIAIVVGLFLGFLFGMSLGPMSFGARLLMFIFQLAFVYPSAALMVKRFHDRDKPGHYAAILLGLIVLKGLTDVLGITGDPFDASALDYVLNLAIFGVSIWFLIELGFLRGTVGTNQYGPDPLSGT